MKECSKCHEIKDYSEFYKSKKSKSGYRSDCKSCGLEYSRSENGKKNYAKSSAKYRAKTDYNKHYYIKNKEEVIKARMEYYYNGNGKIINRKASAKRRASKLQATPPWLDEGMLAEIEMIYLCCPEGYHVDHIHPLQGKDICGLHVPWNLQYLTTEENLRKSNKYRDEV